MHPPPYHRVTVPTCPLINLFLQERNDTLGDGFAHVVASFFLKVDAVEVLVFCKLGGDDGEEIIHGHVILFHNLNRGLIALNHDCRRTLSA